jgi:RimJ/RimL family protein N-acetyltransferase
MVANETIIVTAHLRLRCWRISDDEAFAALHADPEVMRDYGGPIGRCMSDAKLERYRAAFEQHGYTRWAIEGRDGAFLGYTGCLPAASDHPLGPHTDIGWRLRRSAWGQGYATEAARAALDDMAARHRAIGVLAYTAPGNMRSQAVMQRLGLRRDAGRDFTVPFGAEIWQGNVWVATPMHD